MQEQIFKEKKKGCPWRAKDVYSRWYVCIGTETRGRLRTRRKCTFKNCPIAFWILEYKANGYL